MVSLTDRENGYPIVATYRYGPWGEVLSAEGTCAGQPIRYAGYYHDAETGLYYLKGRYYSPALGRFLTRDPARVSPDYVYAASNPLRFIDPTGYGQIAIDGACSQAPAYLETFVCSAVTGERLAVTVSLEEIGNALSKGAVVLSWVGTIGCLFVPGLNVFVFIVCAGMTAVNAGISAYRCWGTGEISEEQFWWSLACSAASITFGGAGCMARGGATLVYTAAANSTTLAGAYFTWVDVKP